jgi:hypothetical protein
MTIPPAWVATGLQAAEEGNRLLTTLKSSHTTGNRYMFLGQKPRNICWWLRNITYVSQPTEKHNWGIYLDERKTARTSGPRNISYVPRLRGTEEHKSLCSSINRGTYPNLLSLAQNRGTYANLRSSAKTKEHIRPYISRPKSRNISDLTFLSPKSRNIYELTFLGQPWNISELMFLGQPRNINYVHRWADEHNRWT